MSLTPVTPTALDSEATLCSETLACSEDLACSDLLGQHLEPEDPDAL